MHFTVDGTLLEAWASQKSFQRKDDPTPPIIAPAAVDDLLLIAAVWVDPHAADAQLVFTNNARATLEALRAGRERMPRIDDVLAARRTPFNPFFPPPT